MSSVCSPFFFVAEIQTVKKKIIDFLLVFFVKMRISTEVGVCYSFKDVAKVASYLLVLL